MRSRDPGRGHVAAVNMDTITSSLCDTCKERKWQYRCPGCNGRSCSLPCVKQHKLERGCDGKRCKTAFVSLSEFTDSQLYSDYYFLEDVGRFVDSTHRDHVWRARESNDSQQKRRNFHRLLTAAEKRGIRLTLLPQGMALHKLNTTRATWKGHYPKGKCHITWRVHLNFPQSEVEYQEPQVPETTLLSALLLKYIDPAESDPIARHRLRKYVRNGGVDGVEVFMKVERVRPKSLRYYRLDKSKSLVDNLCHKTVVEFPVLEVVMGDKCSAYELPNTPIERNPLAVSEELGTSCKQPRDGEEKQGSDCKRCYKEQNCGCSEVQEAMDLECGVADKHVDMNAISSLQMIAEMYSDDDDQ